MKDNTRRRRAALVGKGVLLLLLLNALYLLFMTLAYCIPREGRVRDHIEESLGTWQDESTSPVFDNMKAYWPDVHSDLIWVNCALSEAGGHPLYNAVALPYQTNPNIDSQEDDYQWQNIVTAMYYSNDPTTVGQTYSRYWMLCVGFLRILFTFLNAGELRFLFWMIVATLFLYVVYKITVLLGWRGLVPFGLALLMRSLLLQTASISTGSDVLIFLLAMAVVATYGQSSWFRKYRCLFYLAVGSLSFALGPLVAPLLTIAMPMILEISLNEKREAPESERQLFISALAGGLFWLAGYVGSMMIKGVLSELFVGSTGDGQGMFVYYLGPGQGIAERLFRVGYCFQGLLAPLQVKVPYVILLGLFLTVLFVRREHRTPKHAALYLAIAALPVVWSFIVVEHSKHYFVANIYAALVYALLTLILSAVGERRTGLRQRKAT